MVEHSEPRKMKRRGFLSSLAAVGVAGAGSASGQWVKKSLNIPLELHDNVADLSSIYDNLRARTDLARNNVTIHIKFGNGSLGEIDTDTIEWLQNTASKHFSHYDQKPNSILMDNSPLVEIRVRIRADKANPHVVTQHAIQLSATSLKILNRDQVEAMIAHEVDGHFATYVEKDDSNFPNERYADCRAAKVARPEVLRSAIIAGDDYNAKIAQAHPNIIWSPGHSPQTHAQRVSTLDSLISNPSQSCKSFSVK